MVIDKQSQTQSMPLLGKRKKKRWKKDGTRGCRCESKGGNINWLQLGHEEERIATK